MPRKRTHGPESGNGGNSQWPASTVSMWALDRIIPYPNNPRQHPPEQLALLASSMLVEGVTMPILVDEAGVIIAGHGRLLAAQKNGFAEYPVVVAKGWSDEKKRSARIRDNSISLLSSWDAGLIKMEIGELKLAGYDIPLLAFPEAQLRGWGITVGTEGETDPEVAPRATKKPIVRRGDLWLLGAHRILCGDATSESDVAVCLDEAKPNLMVTDPPYGVDYDPDWRNRAFRDGSLTYKIGGRAIGRVQNDSRVDWQEAWNLFSGSVAYIWHASGYGSLVQASLAKAGLLFRSQIIWNKDRMIIGRGDYHWKHEACFYVVRKGKPGNWRGDRKQTTVWDIAHRASETGHGTQKPIECMKRPIENNSRAGDFVYEPFAGSGTTIIACEMTGRKALAIEIDPGYVQVCIERWQTFSGKKATLDGKTLEQAAAARRKGRAKGESTKDQPASVRPARRGNGLHPPRVDPATEPAGDGA